MVICSTAPNFMSRLKKVYFVDFSWYKPDDERRVKCRWFHLLRFNFNFKHWAKPKWLYVNKQVSDHQHIKLLKKSQVFLIRINFSICLRGLPRQTNRPDDSKKNDVTTDKIYEQEQLVPCCPIMNEWHSFPNYYRSYVS